MITAIAIPFQVVNEAFELKVDTREPGSSLGTGGMSTKIAAARTAHCAGVLAGSGAPKVAFSCPISGLTVLNCLTMVYERYFYSSSILINQRSTGGHHPVAEVSIHERSPKWMIQIIWMIWRYPHSRKPPKLRIMFDNGIQLICQYLG